MQKPWLESYPDGIPAELPPPAYTSLLEMIEDCLDTFADRPAYTNMGTTLTYRDLDLRSRELAAYFQKKLGLVKGERVAIMLPNVLQYPVALCAVFRAGLVAVNVNPMYTARELRHQLADSGARAIVILENFAHVLDDVIADTDIEHVITTGIGDLLRFPKGAIVNFVLRHMRRQVPAYALPGAVPLGNALAEGRRLELAPVQLGYADIAFLQYTGGTTGVSKGAMLSHRNMVYNVHQSKAWQGEVFDAVDRLVVITALPLYHIFSLEANCLGIMKEGGESVLITNPRDMPAFVEELKRHDFVYITGVNTLFAGLLNTPGFSELDFSSLRLTIGGGMAVQESVSKRWKQVTGRHIVQAYGLTETSPAAVINPLHVDDFSGSIGLPISSTDVRICNEQGRELPFGEIGEICIRGPQVMEGYWKRPEETAEVMLPGGWLRTGDLGRMDEQGYVYIEDRKKDMILVSGFNVYPNEVESVAAELDGVLEAAAVGVADDKSGEVVKLFVVRKSEDVTADAIIAHCRKNLTAYKVPREVEFREELPKTNVGKILRRALREEEAER
ncbi:MAG: AMP-binding protein [Woeseiaceae bacterium]|nr:AMP-binding protein [Woeseiaceae bacterium]